MLTDREIKSITLPLKGSTKKFDGGGLYIEVYPSGTKHWRLKYIRPTDKKEDRLILGKYPDVSLKQVRLLREQAKALIASGIDPKQNKKEQSQATAQELTHSFEYIARQWFSNRKDDSQRWTPEHAKRIIRSLEIHVFPILGKHDIKSIMPMDILNLTKSIEAQNKLDTAHRVLDVIRQVFTYALKLRICIFNPASDLSSELKTHIPQNYPSITDENELKKLLLDIEQWSGTPAVRALLRISPYVFVRPSEVRLMKWCEIDFINALWTKSATDMKNDLTHSIPLSSQVIALLNDLKPFSGHREYVFWNNATQKPLSEGASRKALQALGYKGKFTPHGWRHTASTILHEKGYNSMWIEAQLSHKDPNQIRATYNHAQYLNDRTIMMQDWANYLDELKGNVQWN